MTDSGQQKGKAILTFNDKKYEIETLKDKSKELLKAAQVADSQIKITEDNLKLLNVAKQTIAAKLANELESEKSLN
tara:strand:+ start:131 stop:358 length:228 start_codon:yes stop_codon:yes gene_type:complete